MADDDGVPAHLKATRPRTHARRRRVLVLAALVVVGVLALVVAVGDGEDGSGPEARADADQLGGTSGGPVGCIPCDGQHRYLAAGATARPGVAEGERTPDDPAYLATAQAFDARGTIRDLRVTVQTKDRGRWSLSILVNGTEVMGCVIEPNGSGCTDEERSAEVSEGDEVVALIGNEADAEIYFPNGTDEPAVVDLENDGKLAVSFVYDFVPA